MSLKNIIFNKTSTTLKMSDSTIKSFPTLTTERLLLRQLSEHDAQEIFLLRSDTAINKYLDRAPCNTLDDAMGFIRKINENSTLNYWAITLKDTGKLIGTICLFGFSEEIKKGEVGYELSAEHQGKGIMNEAAKEIIRYAFQVLGLKAIEAFTHKDNENSTKLLRKLDFEQTGVDGENPDLIVFRLSYSRYLP